MRISPFSRHAGLTALAVHTVAVVGFSFVVWSQLQNSHEAGMLWMIWMLIDFPASLFAIPLNVLTAGLVNSTVYYTLGFGSFFAIFGGLQYYFLVGYFAGKRRDRTNQGGQAS